MAFYIALTVVCFVTFMADIVLRYMEKIRSFGMEQRLHNIKGKTIPIEDFIPHNITMLTIFGTAMGVCGILLKLLALHPFISFPVALMAGSLVNFTVMHFIKPLLSHGEGEELPRSADLSSCKAFCTEAIPGDSYGRISVTYKGGQYEFEAISEYETDIAPGEQVIVLYRDEQFCVVEKPSEVLDILISDNEEQ